MSDQEYCNINGHWQDVDRATKFGSIWPAYAVIWILSPPMCEPTRTDPNFPGAYSFLQPIDHQSHQLTPRPRIFNREVVRKPMSDPANRAKAWPLAPAELNDQVCFSSFDPENMQRLTCRLYAYF